MESGDWHLVRSPISTNLHAWQYKRGQDRPREAWLWAKGNPQGPAWVKGLPEGKAKRAARVAVAEQVANDRDHADHQRAAKWLGAMKRKRGVRLFTSAIPKLGFVRVSVQRTAGCLSVTDAAVTLVGMVESLGKIHEFVADDFPSSATWPAWCDSASRTTDAHLNVLAARHGPRLATLDEYIPDSFLIPDFE